MSCCRVADRGEASTTFFAAPHSSRMIEIPAGCGILKVCLILACFCLLSMFCLSSR